MSNAADHIDALKEKGWPTRRIARAIGCYKFQLKKWHRVPSTMPVDRVAQLEAVAEERPIFYVIDTVLGSRWIIDRMCATLEQARNKCDDEHDRILRLDGKAPWFENEGVSPAKVKNAGGEWIDAS